MLLVKVVALEVLLQYEPSSILIFIMFSCKRSIYKNFFLSTFSLGKELHSQQNNIMIGNSCGGGRGAELLVVNNSNQLPK